MKYLNYFLIFVLSCVSIMTAVLGYWAFEPAIPLVTLVEQKTMLLDRTEKTQFQRGDVVYSWRKVSSIREATHTKVWRIVIADEHNTTIAEYELQPMTTQAGLSERTVRIIALPMDAPLGKYHVRTYGTYTLNPLRDATYELLPRVTFEVVK